MKVLLAIPSYTGSVPLSLVSKIMRLDRPKDVRVNFAYTERVMIEQARNGIITMALKNGDDYVFFVDDDTIPPVDALKIMLEMDKDIISAPVPDRRGEGGIAVFDKNLMPMKEVPEPMEVGAVGMSCTLVKTSVCSKLFEKYERPFDFEIYEENGLMMRFGEDTNFCNRARKEGFEVWATPEIRPIHIGYPKMYQYGREEF